MRTLYPGQGFDWSFNINIIRSTLFFCHFYWESKQDTFDVFNTKWDLYRVYNYVNYVVRTDGVYLNNDDSTDHKTNYNKIRTW
ncbi:hypothetical protein PHJA_002501400 [Phtheirospermum japonicum]|uniref:S-protein homolog n=1 Tax=Phtheirospermum japonicum TaxID=374723 RepID=A0A830D8U7_9LAMI|nr:hypothetical protein PHJA_002501400 [Phtheirospermum japonicum]